MVIKGEYKEPAMTYLVEEKEGSSEYIIKYPYFRKPVIFELPDDDGPVDQYGGPI